MKNNYSVCLSSFIKKSFVVVAAATLVGGFLMPNLAEAATVLGVTQISAVQSYAQNDNTFENGWRWVFDVTVPDNEPVLKMKFADWVGTMGSIPASTNIRFYSAESSNAPNASEAVVISTANTYSDPMNLILGTDLDASKPGRQIQITVEARVPVSSLGGSYSTSYGISSEVDSVKPVITLGGTTPVTLEVKTGYVDAGATAFDNVDLDITADIVTNSNVNTEVLGAYTVTYDVSDSAGNQAVQAKRDVNVVDTTKPVITLIGANPQVVEVNTPYLELGANVSDNYDLELTAAIDASSVNTAVLGSYTVTYNAEDSSHNIADPVVRTVNVVDTTKPVITLNGSSVVNLTVGDLYTDAGATASDNFDGTLPVDVTGSVDVNNVGVYVMHYNATDSSENTAIEVTRTVNVDVRQISVAADSQTKVFDETDPALTYHIVSGELMGGDAFSGSLGRVIGEDVGTYAIVQGTLSLNSNYSLVFTPSTLTITPAPVEITLGNLNQNYDGTPKSVTVDTLPPGISTSVMYDSLFEVPVNAGSFAVEVVVTNPNYSGSANGTLVISKADAVVTAVGVNKVYDGTPNASVVFSVSGAVGSDILTAMGDASFADKNVGNGKMISVSNIVLGGTGESNYTFNITATASANITQKLLTVSATGGSKVYDGNVSADQVTLDTDAFAGDDVSAFGVSYFFHDKNVGNLKPVEIRGIYINGSDASNYVLNNTTAQTTAAITAKELTVTGLTANSKPYDENTNATLSGTAALSGVVVINLVPDNVVLGGTGVATFANPDVGDNKPVTVTGYTISGTDAGNYTLTQPAGLTADITPPPAPNLILTAPASVNIVKSASLVAENSGIPIINSEVDVAIVGVTPIAVTLQNDGTADSQNVRINPIGANSHLQLWAKDTSGNWYNINVTGWGPVTGFPVPIGYSATTDVYPVSDQAWDYGLTANLVLVSDSSVVASASGVVHVAEPVIVPPPDTTPPSILSYTLNGLADNVTANPTALNPILINLTASENVNWVRVTIENQNDPTNYKFYQPEASCDGNSDCAVTWGGNMSFGALVDGDYSIKVHMNDAANNDFNDYVTPYIITVDTTL